MRSRCRLIVAVVFTLCLVSAGLASAETFGNLDPFETQSGHSANFVLGTEVFIPIDLQLHSFGLMYGHESSGAPAVSNAMFGLYAADPGSGLPATLMAVTDPVNLAAQTTYDLIPFTTTPTIDAGTYWMMALYESAANPRMTLLDASSLVAYWSMPYGSGMPGSAPASSTYLGQDFNYWINGEPVGVATQQSTWSQVRSMF